MNEAELKFVLKTIEEKIGYPDIQTIEGTPTNPEVIINGRKVLMFCSNNYLGLASDPRIKKVVADAVDIYGMGSGGSRLVSGNTNVQEKLEEKIANFKGTENAITFSTGYMTNTGVIPALLNPPVVSVSSYLYKMLLGERSVVFSDELNHASIIDGIKLSKTEKVVYKHLDTRDLEKQLKKRRSYKRKMIITDGVFSMDGDIAPLDKIIPLAKKYDAIVMIDDAHATGILGKTGRGTLEHFNIDHDGSMVLMGTFTKVFGGIGGFIAGSKELIKYLRVMGRTYMFSAPIPPAISAGIMSSIDFVSDEPERRETLWDNVSYLKENLGKYGFNTLGSQTQIVPIFIGDENKAINASRKLLDQGIFISCVRWPAVPHAESRLRLTVSSQHTRHQIDTLIRALIKIKKELKF
jgi:8-amino-7-oxononanoate synthase